MCATPARHRAQRQGVVPEAGFWAAKDLLELTAQGPSGKHARKGTSKYALHIGRVGALAVSLGVGLAVANAGVAYADSDTDSSVSESQADDSAAPPSSPPVDATDQTGVDNDEEPGTADDVDDEEVGEDLAPEEADPSADDDTDVDSGEELPGPSGGSGESPDGSDSTPDEQQAADPDVTAPDSEQVDSSPDETVVSTSEDDQSEEGPALDEADPQGDVAVVDVVNTTTEPVERVSATPSESVESVDIVTALVSTVVSPFASPDAPAQVPWFDALLAWVRRQITHTFFNKTPVYGPVTVEQIFTGQLFIDLNATDPNGDPLTYEIIQPTHGVVVRDVITGNFVYTPTTIVTGEPLQDTFQVVIRDDSEHLTGALGSFQKLLHGVARLFGLAQRDNITVTIPVTIDPLVQLPPTVVTAGLPIFKLGDSPVKVLSSAIIADADSDQISQATIRISTAGQDGDVLNYVAPDGSPITATWDVTTKTLTLSGLATAEQYEEALLAVTFSTTKGGLPRGVSISVTDETGVQSLVPGAAIVTVIGLPPTVTVFGLPIFKLGGSPVKVVSSVTLGDLDSDNLSEATIVIATAYQDGDVLSYTAPSGNPITASWDAATRTLTLSGVASLDQYEEAIKAVSFSATEGGLSRGISFSVTDEAGVQSLVPGAAVVSVIGLPPTVTVFGIPIFKLGGAPVKVVSSVTLGDLDSENLSEATIVIATAYQDGDVLSYTAPSGNPITASWDAATRTLTLSGVATLDQYEEAIKAVTFSATEGGLSRGISFSVTDDAGVQSLVPGAAVVSVIGLPPTVTVFGIPIFKLGGSPVKVVSSVTLGDLDSDNLSEATIVIATAYQDGDVLSYTAPSGNPITASWDAATRTLTLSGVASLDQYEEAIKAVSFSATEGGLSRGISFSVTDEAGVQSLVPGAAIVNVIGLPPTVTVFGIPIFKLGGSPVKVVSSVTLGDLDSENLSEATIVIATAYQDGDVLSYTAPSGNPITASWDAATRTLTLSGVATLDQYEEAIKAVTFSATEGGLSRGISFSVTDDAGVQSLVPGAAVVSVIGLPPTVTVFGIPIFKLGGAPVKVVSSVTLGDLDSENLSEATIVIATAYQDGDVLSYTAPSGNPITASWDAATRTLTLSGVASLDQYEEAIKAVSFSATEGGLSRGISFSVTDDAGVQSLVPGAAIVTVIGLPPTVTVFGLPIFKLGGSPVKVVSSVTLGDLDSDNLSEATIVIATAYQDGDVLSYTAPSGNPITASWDAATRTLTLSGVASLDQYEEAIKAVSFSATEGGLSRGISFSVTDDAGVQSLVPGAAVVSVIGLPPTVTVFGIPIFKLGGAPVKVVSSVTLGDLDSENLSEATIVIATAYQDGDVLSYTAPSGNPITASWDAATRTLTLSGVATLDQYEEAIKAVTFSATEGGLSRGISFSVTDDAGVQSLVPGAAVVSVIGLPPTVTVFGIPIFKLGGSPVKVVSSVTLGDLDSDNLSEATIVIATAYQDGDVLSYTAPSGNPITASWDAATRTLTLSGVASLDQYEEAIKAVSFSATEGGLSRGISFSVTDEAGVQSLVPGAAIVNVIGLPPTVTVFGIPIFKLGGSPVKVVSSVTLGDLDSENLSEATIVIATAYQDGDVLSYTAPSGNPITASWDAATRTLTLSGVATLDQYEEAIKAVTFSATEGGLSRGISFSVTDDAGVQSLVPGAAVVSVIGLPPTVTVFGIPIFKLGGAPVKVVSSVTLGDLDSENLSEATIVIATAYQDGDVLSYTAPSGNPITASWDAATRTLTLSGVASLDQYEEAIKAVSFSATEGGLSRGISFSVTDDAGVQSLVPGAAIVNVIGLPPTVTVFGIPIFKLGGAPVKVVSSVTLGDLDSEKLSEATIVIATAYQDGDVLSYTAPSGNPITASWDAATRTLTLSGVASLDQYEEAIKAVSFSATEGGLSRGISFSVTDDAGVQSLVPGAAVVSVIGLPPTVTVFGIPIFKLGGAPVKVVSSVTLGDLDSENLSEATIVISSAYQTGDVLSYTAPSGNPITASWDAATRTLTLSGVASLDQYEEAIKAVTFSTTEGGLARGVSVSVIDDAGVQSLVPGAAIVNVIGLPPTVTVFGTPIFKLGGAPVKVVSSVTLGDLDSENLSEATIVVASAYQDGDVLSYTAPSGNPITASWDAATRTLTLSGVASLDQYEEAIKAVSFSATEGGLSRGISFSVTDEAGVQSLVPGAAIVNVIGLPPTVTVFGIPIFKLGGSPVKVVSSVTLGDLDSENLSEATIVIATAYQDGDVLSYVAPSGNPITASWDAATRTLTLTGVATLDQYEEAIKAVSFSATEGGLARGVSVSVTDDAQVQSLVPGAAIVSVIGLPPTVTVFGTPIFKLGGAPVKVVSSVTLGDLDSDNLSEATIVITSAYQDGDVLSYVAPSGNPITASWDAATRTLTLSGVATLDQYEEAIKAVTFSTTEGGIARGISVSVTDDAQVQSLVPGAAIVNVIGLPPTVTVFGTPIFKLGGSPVKVVSSVTLGDLDSENLSEATIVIASAYQDGDVLSYTAPSGNPITASWDAATRTLTLSGVATLDQYEEAIKAVTFSATEGGLSRGISFSVTDDAGVQSLVPGAAVVSVIGLPPTVTVFGIPIFKLGGAPVKVVSSVTLGDLDSENLSEATIVISSAYQTGDVLSYTAPSGNPITASWDAATRTLTLSGVASLDQYEEAIKAVTFSTTEGGLARGVSVSVIDDAGVQSLVPGAAIVNVIGLPPTVTVFGTPIFKLGGAPVKVVSSVTLGDLDSENLSEATIVVASAYQDGDVLSYTAPSGNPITASWDAATRTLTLSGVATLDQYEEAIKAVTFSTTEGGIARGISVSVTDDAQVQSLVPGAAIVNVIGLPPTVTVFGTPIFKLGGSPVKVVSSVTLGDLDSENLSEATIVIASAYQDGDVLSYVAPSGNPITASWDAATRTLTLTGVATLDQYEEAIKAVSFSATEGGLARGVSVSVTDDAQVQSLVPGAAIVNVIGLPPTVTVFGTPIFKLGGSPVKVVSSVTLGDLDSDNLSEATIVITSAYQDGDVLSYVAPSGNPITASWDAATRTLTLSGVATLDQYEEAIKAVTFSTTEGGIARGISVSVTDDAQVQSLVPGAAIVNVIGLPPTVTVFGTPIFKLGGSPVKVVSSVTLGDLDSDNLSEATIVIASAYQDGDVLSYVAPSGNPITASWDAATRTLTLSGVASLDQYEEAIKAVTFSTTEGGLARGVSVSVIDDAGVQSLVPGAAIVNVIGLPPTVTVFGTPIFKLGGAPVKVVSSVTLGDLDSENLTEATLVISSAYQTGDVLSYTAPSGNPITASWDAATRTLTLSGVATLDQYEEAIKAVTFSTTEGGIARGISVSVTDDAQVQSLVPGAAIVNVIGLPPTVTVFGTPIFKLGGSPVKVVSSVSLGDLDSDNLSEATIVVATAYQDGDVLSYTAPSGNPITASWNAATRTLTLSGVATLDQYEEAIKAVTFTTNQGGLSRGIQIHVTDDSAVKSLVPGSAIVTVVGLPPSVATIGAPTYTIGTAPVKLIASASIADADSDNMSKATVTIATLGQDGDVLGYIAPSGNPITASWNAATRTLTLAGVATKAQYEEALEAVTFSATGGALLVRGISITVTDDTNVDSLLPGAATANVRYSLQPSVVTVGTPTHTIGTAPVTLLSSATITDADSDMFSSARVTIETLGQSGDVLGYVQPSGNPITATWDAGSKTLTLTGIGTKAQYEEALEAVTFSATGGILFVRGISVSVSDDTGVSSSGLLNGLATATVRENSAPGLWITGGKSYDRNDPPMNPVVTLDISDDLGYLSGATLKVTSFVQSNDTLGYVQPSGNPVTASWDSGSKTLTLSGTATVEQYEQALRAVTFWANQGGWTTRTIAVTVTDNGGKSASGSMTVSVW